jgi:hypothetical protein
VSDYVAFEPSSLQQLSKSLDALAQNLAGNLSKVVSIISAANGHAAGSGNVQAWASKARDDANDMSSRSREAWELVRQGKAYRPPNFAPVFSPGMVNIDWSATSTSGRQAQQDAKDLNLGQAATREQFAAAARSVANHKNDKVYLSQFWANADPRVAQKLARILHDQDMREGGSPDQPLSKSSKIILRDLAIGLAVATRLETVPADKKAALESALENPPNHDMWSSAILFKYGPDGKQYDPKFLKTMGAKALDWRRIYGRMPSLASPDQYKAPDGAWYTSLGIVGPWLSMDGIYRHSQEMRPGTQTVADWDRLATVVADNDPAAAILGRVGENFAASRALLQDRNYAKGIVSPDWTVPIFSGIGKSIDISNAPGRVVVAGTADRAKFPTETANAALNVFLEVAALRKGFPQPIDSVQGNLDLRDKLSPELTRALAVMGRSYIPDLLPAADGNPGETVPDASHQKVVVGSTDLKTYLSVLAKDPVALGIFRGGIDSAITQATRTKLIDGVEAPNDPKHLGELSGLAALAAANEHYNQAEAADMAAARNTKTLTDVVGIATGVPLPALKGAKATTVSWLKFLAGQASGKADGLFDGGNAAEAQFAAEKNYEKVAAEAKLPVAQGIYDAWRQGKLSLPERNAIPVELMQGDNLILRDNAAVSRFNAWFGSLPERITGPYSALQDGFHDSTVAHRSQWEK